MNMAQTNKFRQLLDLGYDHLLCVIPPGEPVREAGKRPGRKGDNGWYGVGVRTFDDVTLALADQWHGWGGGAGIRCNGKFIAIDIDSLSPEWSAKIHKAALNVLGPAPVRIGRAPKCLLVYRAADDIQYRNVRFDDNVDPAKPGLVECLSGGDGTKWFVAIGTHPVTGKPYTWPDGLPHASQLTIVTEQQIAEFFARLSSDLPKAQGTGSTSIDREAVDQEALKGNMVEIAEAVRAIPNDGRFRYDDWIKIAAGIRAACQEDPYVGLDLFCEFSERLPDEEQTEDPTRAYNSLNPPFALGADYILSLAAKHGDEKYRHAQDKKQAEQWFNDEDEDPFGIKIDLNPSEAHKPIIKATPYSFKDPRAIPKREWLYGNHYIRKFVSATVAPSGVGKSSLEIVEALAMATGKPLLGVEPKGQFRVWLWNGEDPLDELERRIGAARLHYGITDEDIGDRLYIDSGRQQEIILATETRNGVLIAEPVVSALVSEIKLNRFDVLQIDPFVSSHRVTENDNNAIDMVSKQWAKIADACNCAVELVHHVRKLNGAEITVEDSRGATSLIATSRSARALTKMQKGEAARLGLETVYRRLFRFGDGKNNLALPADERTDWMELASVPLGNGGGDNLDAVMQGDIIGVVSRFKMPEAAASVSSDEKSAALELIKAGEWRKDIRAGDAWVGNPIAQAMQLDLSEETDKAHVKGIITAWIRDGVLKEVSRQDAKRMQKTFVEVANQDNLSNDIFS